MIHVRHYGSTGPDVVLLHGGPGAPGHMAPIARRMASSCRVVEPFQRGSGARLLTVETHVDDLYEVMEVYEIRRGHLIGSSWGAMLTLAFAAAHPSRVASLVLIGCGTFDGEFRRRFKQILEERLGPAVRSQIEKLAEVERDPDDRLRKTVELLIPAYSHDLVTDDLETVSVDARANQESWDDMLRLQAAGVYPQAFRKIASPVLMLHGEKDPHPGPETRDGLLPFLPQLEYHELKRCGHFPWLERDARDEFFGRLEEWLQTVSRAPAPAHVT